MNNQQKPRESNMELLRIVAMFLVLAVHSNYAAIGVLTHSDLTENVLNGTFRLFYEALSIVCVDVFVLISGWFGIRPSVRGMVKFIFQCCFFYALLAVIPIAAGTMTIRELGGVIMAGHTYWFVCSYIGLYLLSPFLNAFFEHATSKQAWCVTACFWGFLLYFGWLLGERQFYNGYSTLSFVGLYLLARCVRLYGTRVTALAAKWDIIVYLLCALACMGISFVSLWLNIVPEALSARVWSYMNPIVVVESMALLLFFSQWSFSSRLVNTLATGSFGVFLLHLHPVVYPFYTTFAAQLWEQYSGNLMVYSAVILGYMTAVYLIGWTVDLVRQLCWKWIMNMRHT